MNLNNEDTVQIVKKLNDELIEKYGECEPGYFTYETDRYYYEHVKVFGNIIWDSENDDRRVVNEEAKGDEDYYESLETFLRREYNDLIHRLAVRKLYEPI